MNYLEICKENMRKQRKNIKNKLSNLLAIRVSNNNNNQKGGFK